MRDHERLEYDLANWLNRLLERQTGALSFVPTYRPEQVVACSSGTAALHLALETLTAGLTDAERRRSVVLVPDYTMVAVPRAVVLAGMTPVFVDVYADGPHFGTLDPSQVGEAYNKWNRAGMTVRAVVAVALCGRPVDPLVFDGAEKAGLPVVEDLAEAHGLLPDRRTYAAAWSFYRNKVVAGEEGGAVLYQVASRGQEKATDDAYEARLLRCVGFTPEHDYTHVPRGHNYRLADLLAEPIRGSLARFDDNLKARREMVYQYNLSLAAAGIAPLPARTVPWVYDVRLPGITPEAQRHLVRSLQEAGVAARFGFKSMLSQPEFRSSTGRLSPVSAALSSTVVHLPVFGADVPEWKAKETVRTAVGIVAENFSGKNP